MNYRPHVAAATLFVLTIICTAGTSAQDRDRDRTRDPAADQDRSAERDRTQDRDHDRIADSDRLQDRDRARDRDIDGDRTADRDQLHIRDRDQLRDQDIYGAGLMSQQERQQYANRIAEAHTVQEWAQFRARHQSEITARAREQGVEIPEPVYGQQLMTDRERVQLRERLAAAASEEERQQIRAEHRVTMQERARLNQIPIDDLE